MPDLSTEIKGIIARQLEIKNEKVTGNARLIDDLGADSLDIIELLSILEEKFNVQLTDESDNKTTTVEDIVSYIEERAA